MASPTTLLCLLLYLSFAFLGLFFYSCITCFLFSSPLSLRCIAFFVYFSLIPSSLFRSSSSSSLCTPKFFPNLYPILSIILYFFSFLPIFYMPPPDLDSRLILSVPSESSSPSSPSLSISFPSRPSSTSPCKFCPSWPFLPSSSRSPFPPPLHPPYLLYRQPSRLPSPVEKTRASGHPSLWQAPADAGTESTRALQGWLSARSLIFQCASGPPPERRQKKTHKHIHTHI